MWFTIAVAYVAVMLALTRRSWIDAENLDFPQLIKGLIKHSIIAFLGAMVLTVVQSSIVIVPAAHRGVIFDRLKGIQSVQLNEGISFVIPLIQDVTFFDVRIRKAEFEATAASRDLQIVRAKVALNFGPVTEEVSAIYKDYGTEYTEKVVHPALQEAVKAATARYTAEELITKREEVKGQIHELLAKHMAPAHLRLVETYITDFEFSSDFAHAIEAKQIAEQQALKAKRDLDRVRIEADQKIAQAKAEAESLRMQKEAITPMMLELRKIEAQKLGIEKWNGQLPNMMMSDSVPFVNIGDLQKR